MCAERPKQAPLGGAASSDNRHGACCGNDLHGRQAHAACEVLLLDGFDPSGMPEALCSQRFFDDAMLALDDGGLTVINLHAADPRIALIMGRLARSCEGEQALLAVDDAGGGNRVVFAWRGRDFARCRPWAVRWRPTWPRC